MTGDQKGQSGSRAAPERQRQGSAASKAPKRPISPETLTDLDAGPEALPLLTLVQAFAALSDTLEEPSAQEQASRLAYACGALPHVAAAGVLLLDSQQALELAVLSRPDADLAATLRKLADQEPSLHHATSPRTLRLEGPARPRAGATPTARRAAPEPRAVHALPMRVRSDSVGVLCLLVRGRSLPLAERQIALSLAYVATSGLLHLKHRQEATVVNGQLQEALTSRIAIEQAKGVVSHAARLTMSEAFAALRTYARNRNLRLRDVAHDVASGTLPPAAVAGRPPLPQQRPLTHDY